MKITIPPHADISERVLHQRIRNRWIEQLCCLSDGANYVRKTGADEYIQAFFDWIGDDDTLPPCSALTEEERAAFAPVFTLMVSAADADERMSDEAFIRSGWPDQIAAVARTALAVFDRRGEFNEDREQEITATERYHVLKERPEGMPENWVGSPTRSSPGWRWDDPDNPDNSVRGFHGIPDDPTHRQGFIFQVRNGRVLDINGDPLTDPEEEAHALRDHY